MKYQFSELVDTQSISSLFRDFFRTTGLRCDIFTLGGEALTSSSNWVTVCMEFHRKHPLSNQRCIESDTNVLNSLLGDRDYCIYVCRNGMIDAGARVMVGGEHVANILLGQLFCDEPDLQWFRRQALDLGFDEHAYLEAIGRVPVLTRERLETALSFVSRWAAILGELGLRHLKELEAEEALRASEKKYRDIFQDAAEGIFQTGFDGRYMNVNPALCHMHGYDSPEEMLREVPSVEDHLFSDPGQRAFFFALLEKHGRVKAFESRVNTRKDSKIWVSINARAIAGANGAARLEGTMENITERKRAESMMLAAQRSLEDLSRTLLKKLEAERHHVAHELHDEVGQVLTVVKMGLESIKREPASSAFADKLDENIAAIKRALAQVRNLSVNLRPAVLDDLGLVAALRWLASSATSSTGLDIEVQADDDIEPRLSSGLATVCFRVAQEALTNALRHAGASTIKIELCGLRKEFALIISDDGKGFDVKAARAQTSHGGGFGLLAMQERTALSGGTLTIDSTPGEGSKITALFPIRREEEGR